MLKILKSKKLEMYFFAFVNIFSSSSIFAFNFPVANLLSNSKFGCGTTFMVL